MKHNLVDICNNNNLIFQDDNDPKHRSKKTLKWKINNKIKSLKWPSCSPDLNPIENVWELLKKKVAKTKTNTKIEFINCIKSEWNDIKMEIINNLIDSMPNRIQKVINNKGDIIDY